MAYYRRRRYGGYRKKRRYGGYRRNNNQMNSVAKIASQALGIAKWVKDIVNVEYKHTTLDLASLTPSTTPSVTYLTPIPEGDDNDDRNGRSIKLTSLYIRGEVAINNSASATTVRMVIVQAIGDIGGAPTWTDIFSNANVYTMRNITGSVENWKVLADKTINLSKNGTMIKPFKCFLKDMGHAKFSGTSNTDADAGHGCLWLMCMSNEATNTPDVNATSRVRFIDN